jgi:DNA-directed RNA polymerase specialized sigma24 family protein
MISENNETEIEAMVDPELLASFREQGFRDAFAVLWLNHEARLGLFIRGRNASVDQAEDILQETGMKLFRFLSSHVVEIFPKTAYKITKDQLVDAYRAAKRSPKLETLDDLIALNLEPPAAPPSKRLERWNALLRHMDACGVSREQQTAVALHHLIGYSVKEVATIIDCKVETAKARLRYAALKMGRAKKRQGAA